ncbi:hypothetical protein [Streptomyces sp. NPDC058371]|uniref:hypothetical protein n=1 Tax=Streptomyces sp. NPDC058371 TaxID=3346463 RepID=UPI00365AB2A9
MTVLVQPWLGEDVVEHVVVCVDGEPTGLEGALAERLSAPAKSVATELGLAYVRVGFVQDADRFRLSRVDCAGFAADVDWFSEIEIDGSAGRDPDLDQVRFGSYRSRFDTFVGDLRSGGGH